MNSNHSIRQKFTLFLPVLSLWLVSCSGEGDSPRPPTSFKEHVDMFCEHTWDTVKSNDVMDTGTDFLLLALGVPPVSIPTDRIKRNTSEDGLCECTKDFLIKGKQADLFLGAEAESVYKGLKKGTVEELSVQNQAKFMEMTSWIGVFMTKCVYDASLKGN